MGLAITLGLVLVVGFIAWKVFAGLMKVASIVVLFAVAGYLNWQGII